MQTSTPPRIASADKCRDLAFSSQIHFQDVTVVENDFPAFLSRKTDGRSALGGNQGHSNVISRLDGIPRPAVPVKNAGTLRFNTPIHDVPVLVFHVEIDLAMRIAPH